MKLSNTYLGARLSVFVAAFIATAGLLILGGGTVSAAMNQPDAGSVPTYAYDAHAMPSVHATNHAERGPPATIYDNATLHAVDNTSIGSSARPSGCSAGAVYNYDGAAACAVGRHRRYPAGACSRGRRGSPNASGQPCCRKVRSCPRPGQKHGLGAGLIPETWPGSERACTHCGFGRRTAGHRQCLGCWCRTDRIAGPKVPDVCRLPDGGVIQWLTSTGTGGPTIDIFPVNGRQRTVHLADGVPW